MTPLHRVRGVGCSPTVGDGGSDLLLVGHGSRDPRSAAALRGLAANVAARAPARTVRLAFLELSEPLLEDVLAETPGAVAVVPLLLGKAYHARIDLPDRLVAAGRPVPPRLAEPLGPDPLLIRALAGHARSIAGCADAFVLLGTGSSDSRANAAVVTVAEAIQRIVGSPVRAAFVTCGPGPGEAVAALRDAGRHRPGVLPYFLAPGLLLTQGLQRAAAAGSQSVAPTLAGHSSLSRLVLARARQAARVTSLAPAQAAGAAKYGFGPAAANGNLSSPDT